MTIARVETKRLVIGEPSSFSLVKPWSYEADAPINGVLQNEKELFLYGEFTKINTVEAECLASISLKTGYLKRGLKAPEPILRMRKDGIIIALFTTPTQIKAQDNEPIVTQLARYSLTFRQFVPLTFGGKPKAIKAEGCGQIKDFVILPDSSLLLVGSFDEIKVGQVVYKAKGICKLSPSFRQARFSAIAVGVVNTVDLNVATGSILLAGDFVSKDGRGLRLRSNLVTTDLEGNLQDYPCYKQSPLSGAVFTDTGYITASTSGIFLCDFTGRPYLKLSNGKPSYLATIEDERR